MIPAIPVSFRLPAGREIKLAMVDSEAVRALLDHKANHEHIGALEVMAETGIRALQLAPKRPKHCGHLDPAALRHAMLAMHRGAHAIRHAKARHEASGVFGLDAADRNAIMDLADWHAAMNAKGAIPRAIWLQALRDAAAGSGVVLMPIEDLEARQ